MAEAGAFLEEFSSEEKSSLAPLHFGVCVGRFYEDLAQRLLSGARQGFELAGVSGDAVTEVSVPGAYELPFAASRCSWRPASPAPSASSPATTWTRRWRAREATSATRAATPP